MLVREVEDQSPLVQEVEDQWADEQQTGQSTARCWICGDRPFNAHHQLVDHIEGKGDGGKDHLKWRRRWLEEGQPMREDWLEILEKAKTADNNGPVTDAASSTQKIKQAAHAEK